jgi:hypothetical protein
VLSAFAGAYAGNRFLKKVTVASVQRIVAVMLLMIAAPRRRDHLNAYSNKIFCRDVLSHHSFSACAGEDVRYSEHLLMGNPNGAVVSESSPSNYLMMKRQYVLSYNGFLRDRELGRMAHGSIMAG